MAWVNEQHKTPAPLAPVLRGEGLGVRGALGGGQICRPTMNPVPNLPRFQVRVPNYLNETAASITQRSRIATTYELPRVIAALKPSATFCHPSGMTLHNEHPGRVPYRSR